MAGTFIALGTTFVGTIAIVLLVWKKAQQDKAIVITGLKKRMITGKGGIVIPMFE